jgi:hypothetical protein
MPRLNGYLKHGKQYAGRGQKTFGALPIPLMAFEAPLEFSDPASIAIAH